MRLTPLDIRKQEFKKAMRGLDADEVHAFLGTLADEYEAVINDNKALRERLLELDDKVQEYRNMEKTLRDTLLTAERVTVEAKENARREADILVKEAEIEAEKSVRDIRNSAMKLRQEIQILKQQKDGYLSRLRILVESHMKFIESAETDFAEEEQRLEIERKELETERNMTEPPKPKSPEFREILDEAIEQQKNALKEEVPTAGAPGGVEKTAMAESVASGAAKSEDTPAAGSVDMAPGPQPAAVPAQALPVGEKQPQGASTSRWSLNKLKKDILTRTAKDDETS